MVREEITDLKFWRKYCKEVYNYFNGKINPYYPCRKLTVNDYEIPEFMKGGTVTDACVIIDRIVIFAPEIIESLVHTMQKNTDMLAVIRGWIISTIAHELSHMDQYMPWVLSIGSMPEDIRMKYEFDNEMNAERFIDKYKQDIVNNLGYFDTHAFRRLNSYLDYHENNTEWRIKEDTYRKISSPVEKFWNVMSSELLFDFKRMIKEYMIDEMEIVVYNPYADILGKFHEYTTCKVRVCDLYEPETSWSRNNAVDVMRFLSDNVYADTIGGYRKEISVIPYDDDNLTNISICIVIKGLYNEGESTESSKNVYIDKAYRIHSYKECVADWLKEHGLV